MRANLDQEMKHSLFEGDKLLTGLYLKLMMVNILIGLVQPCNQFVDSVLTGKGLGIQALNAYALFLPVGALMLTISSFFAVGTQIVCSHLLGSGRFTETKKLVQTALVSEVVLSFLLALIMFGFSSIIAMLLGADPSVPGQIRDTAAYLRGYAPGIPAVVLVGTLLSLLQLEGRKRLVVFLSVCIFVINWAGDLANLYVFKKGLFGMAAATAAANIIVCILLVIFFLTSSRMFHFSLAGFQKKDFLSICGNGLPSMSYYGSLVIRSAFFNMLILTRLEENTLAVMLVVSSFLTVIDAFMGGIGDATLLLGGVLFGQRDIKGQRKMLKTALAAGGVLLLVTSIVTIVFAVPIAGLFSNNSDPEFIDRAAHAIRLSSLCFVFNALACVLKKYIQSVGRAGYTLVTNVLCNVVYVCVAAWTLVCMVGSDGLFLSFLVCYFLMLITHILYAFYVSRTNGTKGFDRLLYLPKDYEVSDEDQWVCSIMDLDGCIKASRQTMDLCLAKGKDAGKAYLLSLFTEEMTTNAVIHGFRPGRHNIIVLKLLFVGEKITLSILDNCAYFDPIHYYERLQGNRDAVSGIGIRLVIKLSKNTVYTSSFSLNNVKIEV